uniref:Uncharacterized protein n=1 Tax=Cyprinus carpio TaxID=7962 RepID=A0A8C2HTL8_CYPCA
MKRVQLKDTAIPAQSSVASRAAHIKNDTDNKKNQHRSLKVPTTRYGQQNDVREQNRVLTATNEDLQRQLEEIKVITLIIHLMCRLNTFTGFLFVTNLCKVQKNYSNGAQCFFF